MRGTKNKLWYSLHTLDDDDNLQLVKEYIEIHFKFKDYHFRVHLGELGVIISKGISSYCIIPNGDDICMEIYKKDNLSCKGKEKWRLKKRIEDTSDGWYDALNFVNKGLDI